MQEFGKKLETLNSVIGFFNLFSYFQQHSSNLSIKDECLGCPQFLKSVEWPHFLKNSIWLLNIVYWFPYFHQAWPHGVMGNMLVSNPRTPSSNLGGAKFFFSLWIPPYIWFGCFVVDYSGTWWWTARFVRSPKAPRPWTPITFILNLCNVQQYRSCSTAARYLAGSCLATSVLL